MLDIILFHLSIPRLRIFKTLYFNFKTLPISQALKLPILIYGPVAMYWVKGKVEIHSDKIYRGMIKIGKNYEFFNAVDGSSFIYLTPGSKIIFHGPCAIGNNYKIRVHPGAILEFGEYSFLVLQ